VMADGAYDGEAVYQAHCQSPARSTAGRLHPATRVGGAEHGECQGAEPTRSPHPAHRAEGPHGLAESD